MEVLTNILIKKPGTKKAIFSWCLFDWANSPQPTIVVTFLFSAYFAKAIVENEIEGTFLWSQAIAISGIVVAVFGPLLGAIADNLGRRKPWILVFSGLCIASTLALWFATPHRTSIPLALISVGVAATCFEFSIIFYNATLPALAPTKRLGRISGWGWGAGYIGAIICLTLCLLLLIQNNKPPFGLDQADAEHIRATVFVVGIWWILFGWPFFAFVPDSSSTNLTFAKSVVQGLVSVYTTIKQIQHYRNITVFLLARMLYADGLVVLFQFGGLYAAGTFGMNFSEIIQFGIAMNISAGLGAFVFAWLDDKLGSKVTIILSLLGLIVFGTTLILIESIFWFWVLGLALSLFIGPTQAASRTMLARLAPEGKRTEMFGLFALSGKCTAFLGPMLFGWATLVFETQRAGMATIIGFWLFGLVLLIFVKENGKAE